ncbi:hypothetical protein P9112_004342 [Eukaryota sp. TZLM1-RC]
MVLVPLHQQLQDKLAALRQRRAFNVEQWVDQKISMFVDFLSRNNLSGAVLSLSGGIDSSAVLALCSKAMSIPHSPLKRLIAIAQPIHSTVKIQNRAYEVADFLGVECITVDQTQIHDQLVDLVDTAVGINSSFFAKGQLRSYQRTPVNYFIAQLLSQEGFPAVVVGTGNFDEDGYLRYFCKAGDGVVDVQLIADLHKSEVYEVARFLNLPDSIVNSVPSADLWESQTDEEELGMPYDFIELLTEWMKLEDEERKEFICDLGDEAERQFFSMKNKADDIHRRNAHKVGFPVNLNILE